MNNIRLFGTVYAENHLEGHRAECAVDGREDSYWAAERYYSWWMMDCGLPCQMDSITVRPLCGPMDYVQYAVDYSCDGINWMCLCEKLDDTPPVKGGETYPANEVARFIRVTMTYHSKAEQVGLYDVTIMGHCLQDKQQLVSSLGQACVLATDCASYQGFSSCKGRELDVPYSVDMLFCENQGGYLVFGGIDFNSIEAKQMRAYTYLPQKDKTLSVQINVHLDSLDGQCIGTAHITRQYTPWVTFGWDIDTGISGTHDLYLSIDALEAPQQIGFLWLSIDPRPRLSQQIVDCANDPASTEGSLQVFFGNFHSHTGFSDGSSVPDVAYDHARYQAKIDFLGITEHSNLFDHPFDASKSRKWRDLKEIAQRKTEDGKFLALIGTETTWYNQFGHMNIYGADFFLNPYEVKYNDTDQYYNTLKQFPLVINQWNHPWSCGQRHLDMFEPYDAELDEIMYTIEINSIEVPEQDGLFYYLHALDLGWHVSPVGSQDNHKENWGTQNDIRTGILARSLRKADFYDAIRQHRTYYTCAPRLKVQFQVNGLIMGQIAPSSDLYAFQIQIENTEGDSPLDRVEVIGAQGTILMSKLLCGHQEIIELEITNQSPYFFLKVYQENGAFAATAPVWVE